MMTDCLTREFRAQLTRTMDSVLRGAMFEIMKIFENSLHDCQMELAQKGEEVAQLKIKLQGAEMKMIRSEVGGDSRAEMNKTQTDDSQKEAEDVPNTSGQPADVPEFDFEVPDDWCAPLGCETAAKPDDGVCPSVRLRQLYIPLWHIPIKQEMVSRDIESHQQKKQGKKSSKGSSIKGGHKHTQDESSTEGNPGTRCPPLRNNMKILHKNLRHEHSDQTGKSMCLRKEGMKSTGKKTPNTLKSKKEEGKMKATESKSTGQETMKNNDEKTYACRFCKKVFDTQFGRSVHVRTHKRCRGCKKIFPFPSVLIVHKQCCAKLKRLLEKEAQCNDLSTTQTRNEENADVPSKKEVILKKKSTPSSDAHNETSIQKGEATKKFSCVHCGKKCRSYGKMKVHMRLHADSNPFPCSFCPKKFHIHQALRLHMTRKHKDQEKSSEANGGLEWTMPLEVNEETQEDLISLRSEKSRAINHNKVEPENKSDRRPDVRWQTWGKQCSSGFKCSLCQKVLANKYRLIEHFRIHTGEKPIQCELCHAKFRFSAQLHVHKKRGCHITIQCNKCEQQFHSQKKYDKHMFQHNREWPHYCKLCGKGFLTEGWLRNHTELHK